MRWHCDCQEGKWAANLYTLQPELFLCSLFCLVLVLSKPKVADRMSSNLFLALLMYFCANVLLLLEKVLESWMIFPYSLSQQVSLCSGFGPLVNGVLCTFLFLRHSFCNLLNFWGGGIKCWHVLVETCCCLRSGFWMPLYPMFSASARGPCFLPFISLVYLLFLSGNNSSCVYSYFGFFLVCVMWHGKNESSCITW